MQICSVDWVQEQKQRQLEVKLVITYPFYQGTLEARQNCYISSKKSHG